MAKTIRISCTAADIVDHRKLIPFQGALKSLSKEGYEKLRRSITDYGITAPVHAWRHKGKLYNLDGHQRCRVLGEMEKEGWTVPNIPVAYVKARSHEEAKRILLTHASYYGDVDRQGMYEYMVENQIDMEFLKGLADIPGVDPDAFSAEFFQEMRDVNFKAGVGATEYGEEQFQKFQHRCPRCGFEFDEKKKG